MSGVVKSPVLRHKKKDDTTYVRRPGPEKVQLTPEQQLDEAWVTYLSTTPGSEAARGWLREYQRLRDVGVVSMTVVADGD